MQRQLPQRLLCALAIVFGAVLNSAAAPAQAAGGPATLVKDFDPTPYQPAFSASGPFVAIGGTLFFSAEDDSHGWELWASDGTSAGTRLVSDIWAGAGGSSPSGLTDLNGALLFFADDGSHGNELWKSDGTAAGTVLVKDIFPGAAASISHAGTLSGGRAFFVADDGVHGGELWASDGTPAGTQLVKDITAGMPSTSPSWLTDVDGTLFFSTNDYYDGDTLWKTDGTPAGTVALKLIPPGPFNSSTVVNLTAVGRRLFFWDWQSLWVSDGTPAGTVAIPAAPGGFYDTPIIFNGALVFLGYSQANQARLWASDGAGVRPIKDFPAAGNTSGAQMTVVGGSFIFLVHNTDYQVEIWRSNGDAAGTVMLYRFAAGTTMSGLTSAGGTLFFIATDSQHTQLWKSDGSAAGTLLVKQIEVTVNSELQKAISVAGRLVFTACTSLAECQLWGSDGTTAGTVQLRGPSSSVNSLIAAQGAGFLQACGAGGCSVLRTDGTPAGTLELRAAHPSAPPAIRQPQRIGGRIFFSAGEKDNELWVSDGRVAGTIRLMKGPAADSLRYLTPVGDTLFFLVIDNPSIGARSLWASDGTPAGTRQVKALSPPGYKRVQTASFAGGLVLSDGSELWRSDGTPAGTVLLADLSSLDQYIISLRAAGPLLFFSACPYNNGPCTLWASDGSANGTRQLRSFDLVDCSRGGCGPATIGDLFSIDSTLFFAAQDSGRWGLWRSDGTAAGNIRLHVGQPEQLTTAGGRLFFSTDDAVNGQELWTSNGTAAGTHLLKNIWPGPASSAPANLTAVDNTLFFTASDPEHGRELWASDGTPAGTRMVQDMTPGPTGSNPSDLTAVNGQLFFSAEGPGQGRELWVRDSDGTRQVQDIAPGPLSASPSALVAAGPRLLFSANDDAAGPALWALPLASQPFRSVSAGAHAVILAADFDRGGAGLAYHDADPADRGGAAYRPGEGVDIQVADGRPYLAFAQAGEWLRYRLRAPQAKRFTVRVAVASLVAGGTFHLELDGADVSGPVRVPATGGWTTWRTLALPDLELSQGPHSLRLVLDSNGDSPAVGNFDWLELTAADRQAVSLPLVSR